MEQIPADLLRVYVPGRNLAEVLPNLRRTYCSTIAFEIEHISSHEQRVWLREHIEFGQVPARAHRRGPAPTPRATHQGRRHGALPARRIPRAEDVLPRRARRAGADARDADDHGRRRRHRRGGDGHVASRPARGGRARRQSLVRVDPQRLRAGVGAARDRSLRFDRRREVPHRRHRHLSHRERQGDPGPAAAKPEPPRGDRPGGRGVVPRGADAASRDDAAPRSDGGAARC